jgi:8-oxo-dGTP pyrophosphatase MutT (NUDIX family)
MRWHLHGERAIYESRWMRVGVADVELPDGEHIEHDVVRLPRPASAAVVRDDNGRVLLLWRHRFITDSWSWELPGGEIDEGESPEDAAVRETLEETGWRATGMRYVGRFHPIPGRVEQTFHVCAADGAEHVGEPADPHEAERIVWVALDDVRRFIRDGQIVDGYTLAGLRLAEL